AELPPRICSVVVGPRVSERLVPRTRGSEPDDPRRLLVVGHRVIEACTWTRGGRHVLPRVRSEVVRPRVARAKPAKEDDAIRGFVVRHRVIPPTGRMARKRSLRPCVRIDVVRPRLAKFVEHDEAISFRGVRGARAVNRKWSRA